MRKQVEESTAAESARRATRPAAERDRKGRFSARRKRATVLRLLRGENLESVSRELGITAARASQWRDQFLAAGQQVGALVVDDEAVIVDAIRAPTVAWGMERQNPGSPQPTPGADGIGQHHGDVRVWPPVRRARDGL